jgi:hypothetical protein
LNLGVSRNRLSELLADPGSQSFSQPFLHQYWPEQVSTVVAGDLPRIAVVVDAYCEKKTTRRCFLSFHIIIIKRYDLPRQAQDT